MNHRKGASPSIFKAPSEKQKSLFAKSFYAFSVFVFLLLVSRGCGNGNSTNAGTSSIVSSDALLWSIATAGEEPIVCSATSLGMKLTFKDPSGTIELNERCWTGWIDLPVGVDFEVPTTGDWVEYYFWDGTRTMIEEKGNSPAWMGTIRGSKFRLRGKGTATVMLAPAIPPTVRKKEPVLKNEGKEEESAEEREDDFIESVRNSTHKPPQFGGFFIFLLRKIFTIISGGGCFLKIVSDYRCGSTNCNFLTFIGRGGRFR